MTIRASKMGPGLAKPDLPMRQMYTQAKQAKNVLVWFRRDLRLHDNETLVYASEKAKERNAKVNFAYINRRDRAETVWYNRQGGASRTWLLGALTALDELLRKTYGNGAQLIYKDCQDDHEDVADALAQIAEACGSSEVYHGCCHEPHLIEEERQVQKLLMQKYKIRTKAFSTYLLRDPSAISIDMRTWKGHFGTLMPFLHASGLKGYFFHEIEILPVPDIPVCTESIAQQTGWTLKGMDRSRPWAQKIMKSWKENQYSTAGGFGEIDALQILDEFVKNKMRKYESSRGFADGRSVSHLSPYIHFGQLSVRFMMYLLKKSGCETESKTFWRRLIWRDLAYWQLHHWPNMPTVPMRKFYEKQEWSESRDRLEKWKYGNTGFPLVDAGMRELWATGWMQQNARMCTALFLTEYLNISWVEGAKWFHDTLFDADLAINSMMWQNAGKSGLDQWNFTVSPVSKSLDPTGTYVRKWIPELGKLPNQYILTPWEASELVLLKANVVLGETYPERMDKMENLPTARMRNLEAIQKVRRIAQAAGFVDVDGYDLIKVPRHSCKGDNNGKIKIFTKPELRKGTKVVGAESPRKHINQSRKRKDWKKRKQTTVAKTGKLKQLSLEDMVRMSEYRDKL